MGRSKAFRRFHNFLKKIWAKKLIKMRTADISNYIITNKEIGRVANSPQSCSCDICGNPRHHRKSKKDQLTLQERKANEKFQYRDDTYYDDENLI